MICSEEKMCQIYEKILHSIQKYIDYDKADEITNDYSLTKLGIDSICFIEIIVEIEEIFNIEFPDEFLIRSKLDTVNQIAECVHDILKIEKRFII